MHINVNGLPQVSICNVDGTGLTRLTDDPKGRYGTLFTQGGGPARGISIHYAGSDPLQWEVVHWRLDDPDNAIVVPNASIELGARFAPGHGNLLIFFRRYAGVPPSFRPVKLDCATLEEEDISPGTYGDCRDGWITFPPEFGGEMAVVAITGTFANPRTHVRVWRKIAGVWTEVWTLAIGDIDPGSPSPGTRWFFSSLEPIVGGQGWNGHTYFTCDIQNAASQPSRGQTWLLAMNGTSYRLDQGALNVYREAENLILPDGRLIVYAIGTMNSHIGMWRMRTDLLPMRDAELMSHPQEDYLDPEYLEDRVVFQDGDDVAWIGDLDDDGNLVSSTGKDIRLAENLWPVAFGTPSPVNGPELVPMNDESETWS